MPDRDACLIGVLILGVSNTSVVFAELSIPSGLAGLFITICPFWLTGIEAFLPGGARLHWPTILGMLVGFSGAALLVAPDVMHQTLSRNTLSGLLLLQLSMASWSFGSIFQKRRQTKAHPIVVGAIHQLSAGLAILPLALFVPQHPIVWSWRGAGALAYLMIFGSIIAYSAYAYALNKLPVAVVSIYPYINSIVAVGVGWLFYRERFGLLEAVAMVIIFMGVAIVKRQSLASTLAPSAPPAAQKTELNMNQNARN